MGTKANLDGTDWLVKTVQHALGDEGYTTQVEMERGAAKDSAASGGGEVDGDENGDED